MANAARAESAPILEALPSAHDNRPAAPQSAHAAPVRQRVGPQFLADSELVVKRPSGNAHKNGTATDTASPGLHHLDEPCIRHGFACSASTCNMTSWLCFYNFEDVRAAINVAVANDQELDQAITDAQLNRYVAVFERICIVLDRELIDKNIVDDLYGHRLHNLLLCQLPTGLVLRPRMNPDRLPGFKKLHQALRKQ